MENYALPALPGDKTTETKKESSVLEQVQKEILYGLDSDSTKRDIFRRRLKKYIEINKDKDKVSVNVIYAMMQLHLAICTSDELTAAFKPRGIGDEEYAENLNNLAAFDRDEMGIDQIDYQHHWDRGFFGSSVRVLDRYDDNTETPVFCIKDPLSWIPDPMGNHIDKPRFHYFEEFMPASAMTEEYGFSETAVKDIEATKGQLTDEQQKTRSEFYSKQGIVDINDDTPNGFYPVINGYTECEGKKAVVTVSRDGLVLLRYKELEPNADGVTEFPVVISWLSPLRGDPRGVSIPDLVEDKQTAESTLMNLRLIDAKFATLGQNFLYDTRAIKNVNELKAPSTNPKWIGINPDSGVPASAAIYPVPRQNIAADSYNVSQELKQQYQLDTGFGPNTLGVPGDKSMTLGEAQQIQANANLRLGLNVQVASWSEKKFWRLWYEAYKANFKSASGKIIRVTTTFGTNVVTIRPDDLKCSTDPDIYVEFKSKAKALNEQEKAGFMATLPLLLQDPSTPRISKKFALRKSMRLNGMKRDEVYAQVPKDGDELTADYAVQLINKETFPQSIFDGEQKDWMTFLVILSSAIDNKVKFATIEKVKNMLILEGQRQSQTSPGMAGVANSAASQLIGSQISQGNQKKVETVEGALQQA
jgi:hypothetical protein